MCSKKGVTKAAIGCKTNRQYIKRRMKRYDGTLESLEDRSHRPHSHPNRHTPDELKLIADMRRRNPNAGLCVPGKAHAKRLHSLRYVLRRTGEMAVKPLNPKYIPKPYEQIQYPGQKVQMDVKFVPAACIVGDAKGKKFCQHTAIFDSGEIA